MTAKEWLSVMQQAADYNPAMTNLIEKYGQILVAEATKKGQPHTCPVCNGNGKVPNGFYNQTSGDWSTTSITPEICRSCNGTGIVWDVQVVKATKDCYPKEFVEWIFNEGIGKNEDETLFHYVSIQIEGHPFKELKEITFKTLDDLFNYWKKNVK